MDDLKTCKTFASMEETTHSTNWSTRLPTQKKKMGGKKKKKKKTYLKPMGIIP